MPYEEISEDCLTLNIYVPREISYAVRKSVMVWIHGGGFYSGRGSMYNGAYIALHGNVIVVTINYRLGVFGFLSTGNDDLPGNLGLWDQHLALKWVKSNIASYGGDPNSITLFGTSCGGASVSLHSLIPQNENLFHRVIAQSGIANSFLAFVHDPLYYEDSLGNFLGCLHGADTKSLVRCINETSADNILSAQQNMSWHRGDRARYELMFGAVVDGNLFKDYPDKLLNHKTSASFQFFRSVYLLAGMTDKEGSMFYHIFGDMLSEKFNFNPADGFPTDAVCGFLIPGLVKDLFPQCLNQRVLEQAICDKYFGIDDVSRANKTLDLYGDAFFVLPVIKWLRLHSQDNSMTSSYQYLFSRHSNAQDDPTLPPWFVGTPHTAEKTFLFRGVHSNDSKDLELSHKIMGLWTNFAKYGNPNDRSSPKWEPFNDLDRPFYNISSVLSLSTNLFMDRVSFWMLDVPEIITTSCGHLEL
ncbi:liver carboxylesterase-like [Argopecten irradians]|uniref:liver carboxylesterase-like n=1 Tax=Argopecten irradians TaxID=31199 RepID=UPI00371D7BDF